MLHPEERRVVHLNGYEGKAIVLSLTLGFAACGARTDTDLRGFAGTGGDAPPSFGGDTATGGSIATGGAGASGRPVFATGGRGAGGRAPTGGAGGVVFPSGGAVGIVLGSGGVVTEAGGQSGRTPESERLLPFVCWDPCKVPQDCPSPAPFSGGCNGITHGCLITCDKGCPDGTQSLSVAGGCFCYDPRVHTAVANSGTCCSSYCGPPYYIECCTGSTCMPDGRCCSGSSCL